MTVCPFDKRTPKMLMTVHTNATDTITRFLQYNEMREVITSRLTQHQ